MTTAEWRATTRTEQGHDEHVRDPALVGRVARWVAATPSTSPREAAVLPAITEKGA